MLPYYNKMNAYWAQVAAYIYMEKCIQYYCCASLGAMLSPGEAQQKLTFCDKEMYAYL